MLDNWAETFRHLRSALESAALAPDAAGKVTPPAALRDLFAALRCDQWDSNRHVYTFGRLPVELSIPAAAGGLIPWWAVLTGRAYAGDLAGLRQVQDAIEKHVEDPKNRPALNPVLTWISFPHTIRVGEGTYENTIKPAVLQQLFDWGADANYDNGSWLERALYTAEEPVVAVWLDNGASFKTVSKAMNAADGNKKLRAVLGGRRFDERLDDDTLAETKFISDIGGLSSFRTIFNFKARRVTEIYEGARMSQPAMKDIDFHDYAAEALEDARRKLVALGGKPGPVFSALDKPPRPRLQAPGGRA